MAGGVIRNFNTKFDKKSKSEILDYHVPAWFRYYEETEYNKDSELYLDLPYVDSSSSKSSVDLDSTLCHDRVLNKTHRKENVPNPHKNLAKSDLKRHPCLKEFSESKERKRSFKLTFEEWLAHKKELKQKELKNRIDAKEKQRKAEEEKQRRLEAQKENFKLWLASKKEKELLKKKERQLQVIFDQQKKEEEEKRRRLEREENFKRWLALKKKSELLKKKQAELEAIRIKQEEELKAQKMAKKENVFKAWIRRKNEEAKEKQRQIEKMLRKTEKLKQQRTVFINPTPWKDI